MGGRRELGWFDCGDPLMGLFSSHRYIPLHCDSAGHGHRRVLGIAIFAIIVSTASWVGDVRLVEAGIQRPTATLLSQSSFVSGTEGSSFQMSLLLTRPLVDEIDVASRLILTSHSPVSSRAEVRAAVDGDLPQIIDAVDYALLDIVDASNDGRSTRVDVSVETEIGKRTASALQMSATGVYPITIDIEMSGTRVIRLISFIERLEPNSFTPTATSTLYLALVGRLGPPVGLDDDTRTMVSSSSRTSMRDWISLLENRPGLISTIALQPEFLDTFARSAPSDQELLIRLQRAVSFDIMSTTFVSMDPSDADRNTLIDVFTRQLRLGETTLSSLFPARVTPRHSWLSMSPLSSGGARVLADLGFRTVVLPPRAREFEEVDPTRLLELALSDDGTMMGVVVEDDLASALERGSTRPIGGEHLVAQQMLADLKLFRSEIAGGSSDRAPHALVLTTETGELPSAAMVNALLDVIARDTRFALTNLDDAVMTMFGDGDFDRIELVDGFSRPSSFPGSSNLGATLQNIEATIDAFGSVLPRGDERTRGWQRILDVLPDNRLTTSERQAVVDSIRSSTQEIASSVVPPASTTFTLGSRESPIRFSVRNDGPTDLDILIRLTSSKLRLPRGDKIVTLPAQTSTAVEFEVSARTNGRFPVTLQLLTPSGDILLGPPSTLTARVNALAGLGQLVTGIALLFLASWWANHFRKQYRRRQFDAHSSSRRHPSGDRPV